jgi:hypothetical protein
LVEAAHKRNRKRQHHKKKKQEMTLAHWKRAPEE